MSQHFLLSAKARSMSLCQSAFKSIHLAASNNVQQIYKVILFLAPFYAV